MVTNFPDATVEIVTKKNKTLRTLAPHRPGTTRKQYTIGRLKPSGNYIRIGGADYEPIVQKIKVTPRSKAVTNDLLLGVFTYFTPFLVDPFRSDFYKIRSESKEIVVQLEYNQFYMYRRFEEIAQSNSPAVFQTYIATYPKSNLVPRAKDKIDSLDLHQSMLAGSEEALDVFIKSHPGSRFSKIAQSQKEKMAEARVQYSLLANSKDLASFKNYILNFPNFKQTPLAVAQALNVAVGTKSLKQLLAYDNEILIPYQSVLSGVDRERLTNLLNAEVDKAIVREKSNPTDNFKSYTNIWNFSQELSKEYSNLNYLEQCRSYSAKIADLFLAEMGKATTEIEQTKLMSKYSGAVVNFDYLGPTENFFVSCLHRTNSYTGSFKLMNQGFLTNYLAHSAEGDNLKNFYELTQGNLEEINLSNGQIIGFKMFANDSPIATYEKQLDGTLKYARYSRGALIKEEFYNYSKGINYTYDYENGKNKSLQDLDSKVSNAESVLKSGNYQEAKRLLTTVCKNNYPKSVGQNVKITELIAECDKQEQIAREFEEQRRVQEEKRQRQIQIAEEQIRQEEFKKMYAQLENTTINYVSRFLKNPNGASWVSYYGPDDTRSMLNKSRNYLPNCDNVFATMITVDATNSFGGYIRSTYVVFFKDNYPCHFEDIKAIDKARNSATRVGDMDNMLSLTLELRGCGCK